MKKIDDFELLWHRDESRFHVAGQEPPTLTAVDHPPPHPRLEKLAWSWMGEDYWFQHLLYRGTDIRTIAVTGQTLGAQFEAERGYVLFADTPGPPNAMSSIDIYYVMKDFSGADWVELNSISNLLRLHIPLSMILGAWRAKPSSSEPSIASLAHVIVEDDSHIAFRVRRAGWFRLSLYEDRPRRFLRSCLGVEHRNSTCWQARYFRITRPFNSDMRRLRRIEAEETEAAR